jgi:hypothetical protein
VPSCASVGNQAQVGTHTYRCVPCCAPTRRGLLYYCTCALACAPQVWMPLGEATASHRAFLEARAGATAATFFVHAGKRQHGNGHHALAA